MILNENQFFHLNFYSSWCSFFTFHFGLISLLTSILRWQKFLYERNFSAQLLPITCVDLFAAFLLLEPTSSTKIIRNLINNFFNYLRFFIWTGNFNRHYTSTLMARACESNDNKTKGFFFFPVVYLQLSIVGELDGKPSYLAFGGIVMSHETYCSPQPSTAQKGIRLTIN